MKQSAKPARKSRKSFRVFHRKRAGAPGVSPEMAARVAAKRVAAHVSLYDAARRIRRAFSTLYKMEIGVIPMNQWEVDTLLAFYAERAAELVGDLTAAFQD